MPYAPIDRLSSRILNVGESTIPRYNLGNGLALTSGNLYLTYFMAEKTETVNNINAYCGGGAATGTTLMQIGIYSPAYTVVKSGSGYPFFFPTDLGDLYLVASIPNDTTLFNISSTKYTRALSTPFYKERGMVYAIGVLFVGTTGPQLIGQAVVNNAAGMVVLNEGPPIATVVTGQVSLLPYLPQAARNLYNTGIAYEANPGTTTNASNAIGLNFTTPSSANLAVAFLPNDIGLPISGTNIPGGTILSGTWNGFSSATISANATGTTTAGQFTVGPAPYSTTTQPRINYVELTP